MLSCGEDLIYAGIQDCSDMHSFGPGMRTCYIIHYVIRGKGTFICNSKSYTVSAGESFVIRPMDYVRYYPDEKDPWKYTWIEFRYGRCSDMLSKIKYSNDETIIGFIDPKRILPIFEMLRKNDFRSKNTNTAKGLAVALLGMYADIFPNRIKNGHEDYFAVACMLIEANYRKSDFKVSDILNVLCVSRTTMHRCFIRSCGMSAGEYIINYRISRASEFLASGLSVKATAISCGFSDPLYFSKVFKNRVGIAPKFYRMRHKK